MKNIYWNRDLKRLVTGNHPVLKVIGRGLIALLIIIALGWLQWLVEQW